MRIPTKANSMDDRGGTEPNNNNDNNLKTILRDFVQEIEIRPTRARRENGVCITDPEFQFLIDDQMVAYSLEDSSCLQRFMCFCCYPFQAKIVDAENSKDELMTVVRPFVPCPIDTCKSHCHQTASFSSRGEEFGKISEDYFYCVPTFTVTDANDQAVYKIHPPTCCGGLCVNCCIEGNPCRRKGCCKFPCHVFPADQEETHGGAPYIGKISKRSKSVTADARSLTISFPDKSTSVEKGLLMGSALFLNAL